MELSKYVLKVKKEDEIILFNTINSCVVAIDNEFINSNEIYDAIGSDNIKFLEENEFFVSDDKALKLFYSKKYSDDTFNLIISPTESCNFKCKYCYENNYDFNNKIELETIDSTYKFIEETVADNDRKIENLHIDFIGGEPLLCKEEIIYTINLFRNLGINIFYTVETNGSLIDDYILKAFENENVIFSVPLSLEDDHNNLRQYKDGKDSYARIIKNIKENTRFFEKNNIKLSLRYNVNNMNYLEFEEFYEQMKKALKFDFGIEIAIINNFSYNNYCNELDISKYYTWKNNISRKYRELNLYSDNILARVTNRGCFAYQGHGLKIFSDGKLGLCNGWDFYNRRGNINNLKDINSFIETFCDIFDKQKKKLDKKCESCKYLFLCGGPRICRKDDQCDFIELDINDYIANI